MQKEIDVLLTAIKHAGKAVFALQQQTVAITLKDNHDPLTEADLLADKILKSYLLGNFPNDGWLSEETADDSKRLNCQRIWVVDPIDGTKEFIQGIPEYAISVALIENQLPILSAVYNPATSELFYASKGKGVWLNDKPIQCKSGYDKKLTILASRSEFNKGAWQPFIDSQHIKATGSIAYKLALVAKGAADATFSLQPKSEWDIAAGVLLVEEAGGKVTDRDKKIFLFNQVNIKIENIIATSGDSFQIIHDLIREKVSAK